jgi:hypothetical protein
LWASGSSRTTGARRKGTALVARATLRTHRLAGARAARPITGRKRAAIASGQRAAIPRRQGTAVARGHWTRRLPGRSRLAGRSRTHSTGLAGLLPGTRRLRTLGRRAALAGLGRGP